MGKGGTSSWKVVKCFDALIMTVKCLVDELFMHYFQIIRRFLEALPPDPIGALFMDPARGRKPQVPNLPTPRKKILRAPMHA